MSEEKEKIVLISTHAGEDPERAIFPLTAGQCGPGHGRGSRGGLAG